ncbi:MAG: hypothetical protein HOL15_07940 [Nitrospinaceae bacterium]|nr:hypothetical protein [Nitrospinaceae bacterium]
MSDDKYFGFKKVQIENFLKAEFKKKFKNNGKISLRKRQKFISDVTRKIGKRFGKDVLVLIDFTRNGFCSVVSPAKTESTDKGKLVKSFSHPQVFYTSHCVDRFSERMQAMDNCIIKLDAFFNEALSTFGENEGFLTCPDGVFAYENMGDRLVIKTYINFDLLSDEQIKQFYGAGMISMLPKEYATEDISGADFILADENEELS